MRRAFCIPIDVTAVPAEKFNVEAERIANAACVKFWRQGHSEACNHCTRLTDMCVNSL